MENEKHDPNAPPLSYEALREMRIQRNREIMTKMVEPVSAIAPTQPASEEGSTRRRPFARRESNKRALETGESDNEGASSPPAPRRRSARLTGVEIDYAALDPDVKDFEDEEGSRRRSRGLGGGALSYNPDVTAALVSRIPKLHREFHGQTPWALDPAANPPPLVLRELAASLEITVEKLLDIALSPGKAYSGSEPGGVSCHWCRQKTYDLKTTCSRCSLVESSMCPGNLCGPCLYNRWGIDILECLANKETWVCPYCRDQCNCSQGCVSSRPNGFNTGTTVGKEAKARNMTVNEYLTKEHGVPFGCFEHVFTVIESSEARKVTDEDDKSTTAVPPLVKHVIRYPDGREIEIQNAKGWGFFRMHRKYYEGVGANSETEIR